MFRVLISRRWLGAMAVALAFGVAAYFLGQWQWHRYEAKAANAARINAHYSATPRPVTQVLSPAPLSLTQEWTRVTMHGHYVVQDTMVVRNRPHDGVYGYEVVVPFTDDTGASVLVDRGWVVNAQNAATLPDFPPAPARPVTVTGWVRPTEPSLGHTLPAGQLASINLTEASRASGLPLLGGYVVLEAERLPDGTAPKRLTPLDPPDTDLGPHQAYAFQWWAAMLAGVVLVLFGARREHLEAMAGGGTTGGAGGTGRGVTGGETPRRPVKVRIWDEEDA